MTSASNRRRSAHMPVRLGAVLASIAGLAMLGKSTEQHPAHGRRLDAHAEEALPVCDFAATSEFPEGLLTREQMASGAIMVHVVVLLYMFAALAIVCDEYFEPCLDTLCESLKLRPNVAGATFMAAGGSMPELATSFMGLFVARSDVGFGAIVGSAVFNVLFVIAACAVVAQGAQLEWYPMFRDCIFYCVSIACLVGFITDQMVQWYEALVLLFLYGIYILLMYFDDSVHAWVTARLSGTTLVHLAPASAPPEGGALDAEVEAGRHGGEAHGRKQGGDTTQPKAAVSPGAPSIDAEPSSVGGGAGQEDDGEEYADPWRVPDAPVARLSWVIALPLALVLHYTIPDTRRPEWKMYYWVAFPICVVWIAAFSFVMVWMATEIGVTANIPAPVMGLTVLAAGTSVPDLLSSVAVARQGQADMAVSSSLGSNAFDILVGLPLPWFLFGAVAFPGEAAPVKSQSLGIMAGLLFFMVAVTLALVVMHEWTLSKRLR
mmetsp:Transcript_20087/g.59346  ORF Transcript_20087/g.59346 Transcript_20087/m.59346 type:complete len:490 (-) Transcript_20087:532-2001(-)